MQSFNILFKNAFLTEKRFIFQNFEPEINLALETRDSSEISPELFERCLETYLETASPALVSFIRTKDDNGDTPLINIVFERFKKKWEEYSKGVELSREKIRELNINNLPEELAHIASHIRAQIESTCVSLRDDFVKKELKEKSLEDELTSLLNRRGYNEHITSRIARCERTDTPLSLLITDVDHFKGFNDKYGHLAGDAVLVELAKRLVVATRGTDLVCRWGGEEFAILLDGANDEKGIAAAGRIMETVTKDPFKITDKARVKHSVHVTISVGGRNYIDSREEMEQGADHDLYVSKGGGEDGKSVDRNGQVGKRNALTFNNVLRSPDEIMRIRSKFSTIPPPPEPED